MKRFIALIVPLLLLFPYAAGVEAKGRSGPAKQSSFRSNCFGGQRNFSAIARNLGLGRDEAAEFKNLALTGEPEFGYIESGFAFEKYLKNGKLTADYVYIIESGKLEMALVMKLTSGREVWSPMGSGEFGIPAHNRSRSKQRVAPPIAAGSDNALGGGEVVDMASFGQIRERIVSEGSPLSSFGTETPRTSASGAQDQPRDGSGDKNGKPFDPFDKVVWGSYYIGESKAGTGKNDETGWSVGAKGRFWLHEDGPHRVGVFGTASVGGSDRPDAKSGWWKAGGGPTVGYNDRQGIDDKLDLGVIYQSNDYGKFDGSYRESQQGLSVYASNYLKLDHRRRAGQELFPDVQVWLSGEFPFMVTGHERSNPSKGQRLPDDPTNFGRIDLTGKVGLYDFWMGEDCDFRLTPQLVLGSLFEFQDKKSYGRIGLGVEAGYKKNVLFDFAGSFRKAFTSKGKNRFPFELSLDLDGIRAWAEGSRIKQPTKADYEARGEKYKAPPPPPFETKFQEETPKVDSDLRSDVARELDGTRMAAMIDPIASHNRETAALLVGVAKSESSYRHHYRHNYWGYARGRRGFKTPEQAVQVVGKKIKEYQSQGLNTPQKLVTRWKCGTSCASHPKQEVRNWVTAASGPYQRIAANL